MLVNHVILGKSLNSSGILNDMRVKRDNNTNVFSTRPANKADSDSSNYFILSARIWFEEEA